MQCFFFLLFIIVHLCKTYLKSKWVNLVIICISTGKLVSLLKPRLTSTTDLDSNIKLHVTDNREKVKMTIISKIWKLCTDCLCTCTQENKACCIIICSPLLKYMYSIYFVSSCNWSIKSTNCYPTFITTMNQMWPYSSCRSYRLQLLSEKYANHKTLSIRERLQT